jgi:hypothetical protein
MERHCSNSSAFAALFAILRVQTDFSQRHRPDKPSREEFLQTEYRVQFHPPDHRPLGHRYIRSYGIHIAWLNLQSKHVKTSGTQLRVSSQETYRSDRTIL